jgi:hypothetical protein
MSGGGGSGGSYGGGRPPDEPYDCDRLRFEAPVHSPVSEAVATLAVGDLLDVELEPAPARRVVVIAPGRTVVGSIVDHLPQLIHCLQRRRFGASVISVDGRVVRVRVEPT